MKVFPFVSSRTKYEDFLSGHLVRPDDLKWEEMRTFLAGSTYDLTQLDDLRYAVFAVGDYCVFGIGCLSRILADKAKYEVDDDLLRDKVRRSLACFIGFAIRISEYKDKGNNEVPDMTSDDFLTACCEMYFKHLKKQWENKCPMTEKIGADGKSSIDGEQCLVDLKTTKDISNKPQEFETFSGINAIAESFNKKWLSYYLNEIINKGNTDESFVSHVEYEDHWNRLSFENACVSESLYSNLPQIDKRKETEKTNKLVKKANDLFEEFKPKFAKLIVEIKGAISDIEKAKNEFDGFLKKLEIDNAEGFLDTLKKLVKIKSDEYKLDDEELNSKYDSLKKELEILKDEENKEKLKDALTPLKQKFNEIKDEKEELKNSRSSVNITELKEKLKEHKTAVKTLEGYEHEFEEIVFTNISTISIEELHNLLVRLTNLRENANSITLDNDSFNRRKKELISKIGEINSEIQRREIAEKEKQEKLKMQQTTGKNQNKNVETMALKNFFDFIIEFSDVAKRYGYDNYEAPDFDDLLEKILKAHKIEPQSRRTNIIKHADIYDVDSNVNTNFTNFIESVKICQKLLNFKRLDEIKNKHEKIRVIIKKKG